MVPSLIALRTAQPGSFLWAQSVNLHCEAKASMSSNTAPKVDSICTTFNSRIPGTSSNMPPPGKQWRERKLVVCLPLASCSRIDPVSVSVVHDREFTIDDFPTPDEPTKAIVEPLASQDSNPSSDLVSVALTVSTGMSP